ncbi:hypothetical protein RO3G_08918 [Rhizopus delemar RA 99-880]|uniref:Uncharacterized protein n=1 Tax=Rhizopus delemar (strain RA 99-880 / ATCC MYA-4621 / FGSC 9543 / NRRL 43880) TaxID=246409 RepID=I1C6X8_RHIO9|nr:hypothetical protein RO3G_08918 [Rhizopus delemar RA 99-880]|eukprot:EIE84208.1 hypothetical protein RO3G_08918 [Rhizopus delemar RA 99-880]
MKLIVVFMMMMMLALSVSAQDHWICSCFRPKYDYGCCDVVKGKMDDGNVCDIPGRGPIYKKYEECCTSIGGTHKCK